MTPPRILAFAWLGALSVALAVVAYSHAASDRKVTHFDEINVRRINIVEPDGKPRVVISSRARMPNAIWRGKEYTHRSHGGGGFLFFNDEGTEAGGMGFSSFSESGAFGATTNLNFDQYEQDNTVQLVYKDDNGRRTAGLRINDRPDQSLLPALELIDRIATAKTPEERERFTAQMKTLEQALTAGHAERFFAGKELGDAVLSLSDQQGRRRLVLKVDGGGAPSIELLDQSGKVVKRIAVN